MVLVMLVVLKNFRVVKMNQGVLQLLHVQVQVQAVVHYPWKRQPVDICLLMRVTANRLLILAWHC